MTSVWLVSYLALWALVIGLSFLCLALAREVTALRTRLDEILHRADVDQLLRADAPTRDAPGETTGDQKLETGRGRSLPLDSAHIPP